MRDEAGLLLRERSILAGRPARDGLGGTEGFAYVATFLALRPAGPATQPDWEDLARALQTVAGAVPGEARAGVTTLGRGGVLARLLCPSAPALHGRGARAVGHVPPTAARASPGTPAKALGMSGTEISRHGGWRAYVAGREGRDG